MSNYKVLLHGKEARQKLAIGADKLASLVVSTLGPRSRNVAISQKNGNPKILHDGVSVAKSIVLKDPFEDMGAALLFEASSKTNDLVGDGTTTATLLANTLIQEGFKLTEGGVSEGVITGKVNPMVLREELLRYSKVIVEELDKRAKKITDKKDYQQIAEVSSSSKEIGGLVADAIEAVGRDGVVMIEEDSGFESRLEFSEGMEFENGFLSRYFITDTDRMIAEYDGEIYVLLTDYTIADAMQLVGIVTKVIEDNNKPLLIIANDVVGPALEALVLTKVNPKTQAKLVAVMAPEFGERRKEMLEDISILTGATIISRDLGQKLEDVELSQLGKLKHVRVSQTHTAFTPAFIDEEEIKERVNALKTQIDEEENAFKKEKLEYRLGKLVGKVAVIKVGGASQSEITEKKERVIDAVHATKAALAEGIVPGGGVALLKINQMWGEESNEILGLVKNALTSPFITIIENSGCKLSDVVQRLGKGGNDGYDVVTKKYGDMFEMGIVDPVKVTKLAIIHAFSIAGNVLTTEGLVADPEEEQVQKVKAV